MRWLVANAGSIGMALFLAVLTWIYLWSESTDSREIKFPFTPAVRAERIARVDFEVDGRSLSPGDSIGVRLTGPRADISAVERSVRTCSPSFEDEQFSELEGRFSYELRREDIWLPESARFQGKPPVIKVHYLKATAPKPETRVFGGVPVRLVGPEEIVRRLKLDSPLVVEVSATGPIEVIEKLSSADFLAYVDVDLKAGELKAGDKMPLRGIRGALRCKVDKPVDLDPMPGVKSASRLVDVTVLPDPMALFGTDGIRDLAGKGNLHPDVVRRVGAAISALLGSRPDLFRNEPRTASRPASGVVIGRDTRISGPDIEAQLTGVIDGDVIAAGVIPTPGVAAMVRGENRALGIVISASHNPADYNGIKVIAPDGRKVPDAAERAIEEWVASGAAPPAPGPSRRRTVSADAARRYAAGLSARFGNRRLGGMRIVVDTANGAASAIAPGLLRSIGADLVVLNGAGDGARINVDAGVLEPERLSARVREERAALGLAFDGDADRCILVDETGAVRDGDFILAVAAEAMAAEGRLPGKVVVSTVMANYGLESWLAARGIALRRSAVGDRWVADEMVACGAMLGGEQSGHVIFREALPTGDGMLTALEILKVMADRGKPLSALCAGFAKAPQVLVNVKVRARPDLASLPGVAAAMRASEVALAGRGRLLVRYSGTEPLCRVMAEGSDGAVVTSAVERVAAALRKEIGL